MEWFMNSNQEWQQIMHIKQNESNTNVDMPKEANDRALILHSNQGLQQSQGLNDQFSLLIDPKLTPLGGAAMDSHQSNQTRHFIDAWSMAERDRTSEIGHSRYSVNSNNKLTFSSLALSIHGGNEASEESQNAQMGFGRESEGDVKSQWMMNPVSWSGSPPPGGPLAEALCLGMAGSTRPPASRSSS
ncbi:Growth-regulating factor [Parasponia andersonii]|uniref:Growth-regulating factor n=1 Tax=Parasponia andersonii TaxID=3476 RepID=A0A2P5DJN9_PARAD|nr:Growth-regulating factor [Parasponia andersonii]